MRNPLSFWQIYSLDARFELSRSHDINAKAAGMAAGRMIFEYQQRINRDWRFDVGVDRGVVSR